MSKQQKEKRSNFSGSLGFFLANVAGAVGLGNLWGFPFKMGRGGGFPFIVIYLIAVFAVGIPIVIAEYGFGRKFRAGPVKAYQAVNQKWGFVGWFHEITCILVMGFYALIVGYLMKYMCMYFVSIFGGGFTAIDGATYFSAMISSPVEPLIWTAIVLGLTYFIIRKDFAAGYEKACKVLLPILFVMLIVVAVRSCTLPGAAEGLKYMFQPNMAAFREIGFFGVFSLAVVQMWFSINVGFGTNIFLSSYMPDGTEITKQAIAVPIADMVVAMLAGLAIMPAVFAYGLDPTSGPGLLFITLKNVFDNMPGGSVFGFIFFVSAFAAGLSTSIGITGALVPIGTEQLGWDLNKSTAASCILSFVLSIPVSLGYGVLSGVHPLAWLGERFAGYDMLDSVDFLGENVFLSFGALFMVVFIGWVWKPDAVLAEVEKMARSPGKSSGCSCSGTSRPSRHSLWRSRRWEFFDQHTKQPCEFSLTRLFI